MYKQKHSWLLGIWADPSMLWNYMEQELFLLLPRVSWSLNSWIKATLLSAVSLITFNFFTMFRAAVKSLSWCQIWGSLLRKPRRKPSASKNNVVRYVTNELGVLIASWSPICSFSLFGGSVFSSFSLKCLSIALFSSKETRESKMLEQLTPHSNTIDDLKIFALRRQQWLGFLEGTSKNCK